MNKRMEIRRELLREIIDGIAQMVELYKTGGSAPLTGHAYDPKDYEREVKLLNQLRDGFLDMEKQESV